MKKYTKPSFEEIELNSMDIIQTSGLTNGGAQGNLTGSGAQAGWATPSTAANEINPIKDPIE